MSEFLQEYVDSRGVPLRVDRAAGVLRGVKLIGLESANGRRYRPEALSAAVGLYEGAKVNVNHPKDGPLSPRDYRDRLGVIRQVEFRTSEGLFGNLHFNPKHALAEQLAWDAENNPRNVGFSHNVVARLCRDGGRTVVEAIDHVQSVDLVADPASTVGLFEQATQAAPASETADAALWESVTLESLQARRPELLEALVDEQLSRLNAELAAASEREQQLARRLRIGELLERHGLKPPAKDRDDDAHRIGEALYESLLAAESDQRVEALISERSDAVRLAAERAAHGERGGRPRSVDPGSIVGRPDATPETAAQFANAIRVSR